MTDLEKNTDARRILRKVGWVLLVVGVLDVGFMIYCILNRVAYASSFNILALIAAWFLFRGSLKAARVIAWFSAFMAASFTGFLLALPVLFPPGLLLVYLRLHPVYVPVSGVVVVALIVMLVWIYRSLTSAPVRAAMNKAGVNLRRIWRRPVFGWVVGAALVVVLVVVMPLLTHGETARKARAQAAIQLGPGYEYFVGSMNVHWDSQGKHVEADVIAYTNHEIRDVHVEWTE